MLIDLRGAYSEALRKVEEGLLHIAHVGLYEDRTVIVLHKELNTKEVKVVDCTKSPQEAETGLPRKVEAPKALVPEEVKKVKRDKNACKHCGRVCRNRSGKSRHEKKCSQKPA